MGYFTEINTLLKLPKDAVEVSALTVGHTYTVIKNKERIFPLHIAILLVTDDWTFLGYCVVRSATIKASKTELTFEVLSLFTHEEQKKYTEKFLEAAKKLVNYENRRHFRYSRPGR